MNRIRANFRCQLTVVEPTRFLMRSVGAYTAMNYLARSELNFTELLKANMAVLSIGVRLVSTVAKRQPFRTDDRFPSPMLFGEDISSPQPRAEVIMQNGSVIRRTRKKHSNIWQFRWWETTLDGKRVYRQREIGTVEQIPNLEAARKVASLLVPELNAGRCRSEPTSLTIGQLCSHFDQRELCLGNTWRSYSTKHIYKVCMGRWIIPRWGDRLLSDISRIEVESWLPSLSIARNSCAKIRNVMSVLFNHACSYEFFDKSPIRLVRQSAKRRTTPVVLTPSEIRTLLGGLKIRERTLVFIAASTVIRQSEPFALKWGGIDLSAGTMNVARSIVHGFISPCKTESSQKPVPIHPLVAEALLKWKKRSKYRRPEDWVFASRHSHGEKPYWGQAILQKYLRPMAQKLGVEKRFGWHTFRHTYSTLLRSVGTEFKVMQELLRHSTLRSTLDVYTQAVTPAKHSAQAAVMSLVFSSQ
jgi:integrase